MVTIELTKKGNAVGFTAKGEIVAGEYSSKAKAWRIFVDSRFVMTDTRTQYFPALAAAKAYAASLVDEVKTNELKWWD